MSLPSRAHRLPPLTRLSLWFGAALFLLLVFLPWVVPFGPLQGDAAGTLAAVVVVGFPALLLAFAARRRDLDARYRQALALLAISMSLASAGNLLRLLATFGVHLPVLPGISLGSNVVIWALGLAALLRIPLVPLGRGVRWRFGTDTTIAVGGLALAIFAVWTLPGFAHAPRSARAQLLAFNAMEAANLVVLSLILVRGPARPLRRAIWCLAATIIVETAYLVAMQYALGQQTGDFRLPNSLFFVDYVAYLFAALFFLTDAQPDTDLPLLPESVRAFNPLPMAAIVGVSILLLRATRHPSDPALFPLALGLGAMAMLLLARVVGATTAILRLVREEAESQRREQSQRLQLMGRLAGGIAHVINNLMGVVLVNSELVVGAAGADQDLRSIGLDIGESAKRASALAGRLLLSSGQGPPNPVREPLLEVVKGQRDPIGRLAGPSHAVTWELDGEGGRALVARAPATAVLRELIANALDATPAGGRITVRVRDEMRSASDAGMTLSPPPGEYSVLEVDDAGRGIAPDALPRVWEPFFTTRPLSEGRGLGLSVVYGVMAGEAGGLQLESAVGSGTRVRLYFPVRPAESDEG